MANYMLNRHYTSILMLLSPLDLLEGLDKPEFLHPQFFMHCTERDEYTQKFMQHANIVRKMDIFLPNTAVDLIGFYQNLPHPQIRFHLYCETDDLVNQYERLERADICEDVFNVNEIEDKLHTAAHSHLLYSINSLKKRDRAGDVDAPDLLFSLGELFEQSAVKINDGIRKKGDLSQQPADNEEE